MIMTSNEEALPELSKLKILKSIRQETPDVFKTLRWFSKWAKKLDRPQVLVFPDWQQDILVRQVAETAQRLGKSYPVPFFTIPIQRKDGVRYITIFSNLKIPAYDFEIAQSGIMISLQNDPYKSLQAKMIGAEFITVYDRTLNAIRGPGFPKGRKAAFVSGPSNLSLIPPKLVMAVASSAVPAGH